MWRDVEGDFDHPGVPVGSALDATCSTDDAFARHL